MRHNICNGVNIARKFRHWTDKHLPSFNAGLGITGGTTPDIVENCVVKKKLEGAARKGYHLKKAPIEYPGAMA